MGIEDILCVVHVICLYMEGYSTVWSHSMLLGPVIW